MNLSLLTVALAASCLLFTGQLMAEPKRPECIAPASPGGGFDLELREREGQLGVVRSRHVRHAAAEAQTTIDGIINQ